MTQPTWTYKPTNEAKVEELYNSLKIHKTLCKLLVQRGIETYEDARLFFRPSIEHLYNPFLMKGMELAVQRIEQAVQNNENILFFGDYDVDGTTAVSLIILFFKQFYDNIDFYVPDRNTEGYGISFQGIDYAANNGFSVMIALDCGIKAIDKVAYANEKNVDVIICDHHTPSEILPEAFAILNPKQKDCLYPYKELTGCGIGFKLCQAFAKKQNIPLEKLYALLDLVCISISCDIVPITSENRVLAYYGLQQLNQNPSIGVKNIVELLKLEKDFTISDVVFKIGPRINAAGRMAHAKAAVNVLVGLEESSTLQSNNQERQELDREITESALAFLSQKENQQSVSNVLFDANWHKGVVGIVASRIIETHFKPTIVLCESNGKLTGSVRSVSGFNVYEPLEACADLFLNFGGHAYAAGLTLEKENFEALKQRFNAEVEKRILPEQLIPKISIDAEIEIKDITANFYNILKQFAPFGPENMRPKFAIKQVKDTGWSKIVGENHLKLYVKDKKGNTLSGIAFNMGDKLPLIQQKFVDICFVIEENTWNGNTKLEMGVRDIKEHL
ncbi:MAG: single-stranded-DNA-specific exonuclease RecJ [Chitinophagales bacterium]|nr:single-stranded-DNA-specific exonuclease RecJ [Chitinophagales bacterium]